MEVLQPEYPVTEAQSNVHESATENATGKSVASEKVTISDKYHNLT